MPLCRATSRVARRISARNCLAAAGLRSRYQDAAALISSAASPRTSTLRCRKELGLKLVDQIFGTHGIGGRSCEPLAQLFSPRRLPSVRIETFVTLFSEAVEKASSELTALVCGEAEDGFHEGVVLHRRQQYSARSVGWLLRGRFVRLRVPETRLQQAGRTTSVMARRRTRVEAAREVACRGRLFAFSWIYSPG